MTTRHTAVADALGSTRAEGLEPGAEVVALLDQWACGEITDAQLDAAKQRIVKANTVQP